jgi:hypothetical protein
MPRSAGVDVVVLRSALRALAHRSPSGRHVGSRSPPTVGSRPRINLARGTMSVARLLMLAGGLMAVIAPRRY